jgi:protein SCO1/2
MAQITIVDASGRIHRQIYGGAFEPPQLMEPLKDVVFGRSRPIDDLGSLIDKVRLFCTIYDPNSGRYHFDYSLFIGIAIGTACLSLVARLLVREWRRSARARPRISTG